VIRILVGHYHSKENKWLIIELGADQDFDLETLKVAEGESSDEDDSDDEGMDED
jgi:hypothetical protein